MRRPSRPLKFCAALFSASLLLTSPALAADVDANGARCALLGPLTLNAQITFIAEQVNGRQEKAITAAGRVGDLVDLHGDLGCDNGRLTEAVECLTRKLLDRASSAPNLIARDCMSDAGVPQP